MYADRLVISSPGGLYGRLTVDDLGKVRPDTRNPVIATVMETLGETENRYSGIPTVRRLLHEAGMAEPLFENARGEFRVTIRADRASAESSVSLKVTLDEPQRKIALFCAENPRSRVEIAEMMGVQPAYAMRRYVKPLVENGILRESLPETPRSPYQRYSTSTNVIARSS